MTGKRQRARAPGLRELTQEAQHRRSIQVLVEHPKSGARHESHDRSESQNEGAAGDRVDQSLESDPRSLRRRDERVTGSHRTGARRHGMAITR